MTRCFRCARGTGGTGGLRCTGNARSAGSFRCTRCAGDSRSPGSTREARCGRSLRTALRAGIQTRVDHGAALRALDRSRINRCWSETHIAVLSRHRADARLFHRRATSARSGASHEGLRPRLSRPRIGAQCRSLEQDFSSGCDEIASPVIS